MTLADDKARMRAEAVARRDALPAHTRREAAEAIAAYGIRFAHPAPGAIVSGFSAIGAEINPYPLMKRLAEAGHQLALPVITPKGNPLIMRRWMPGEPLRNGLWGIREPMPEAPEVDPDVVLAPLLAFDKAGRRLGYGAGYYDRTIARLRAMKPVVVIGIAYDEQEVDEVPVDEHDQVLDWVLTPSGARRLS